MKIKFKLIVPIAFFAFSLLVIGTYILTEMEKISILDREIRESSEIAQVSLDFNVENFHTQLELLEYAYEPNQERLEAFYSHKQTLDESLKKLANLVEKEHSDPDELFHGLYSEATSDVEKIKKNLLLVKEDWILVLDAVNNYQKAKETGASNEELQRLESISRQKIIENEQLFDNLEFNKEIDKFVMSQNILAKELQTQNEKIISDFTVSMYIIIPVTIGLILALYMFISSTITIPIKKLQIATEKYAQGENVKIEHQKNDEIGDLFKKFKNMRKEVDKAKEDSIKSERLSSIGELSARISHDLRNPLAIITGDLEFIKMEDENPTRERNEAYGRIERSINRIDHQMRDVLNFVKESPLDRNNHMLKSILNETLEQLVVPNDISINYPEEDIEIFCDSKKLSAVFTNIILNAIQAMKGKGEITIKTENLEKEMAIYFTDTGPGVPSDSIDKVFELLYTTKQQGKQHGGTISVQNNPSTFKIRFPKA
jgi:signal transduction histidine kinase